MVQFIPHYEAGSNRFGANTLDGYIDLTDLLRGLDLNTDEERRLAIVNKLLADQRAKAYDHERTGKMFHGAAIVKTKDGRWFLQANIHLKNSELTRDCGEANAAVEARGVEGDKFQIDEIWFMGGKANFEQGEIFLGNEGQRNSPCGSCLDIIYDHRLHVDGNTIVHMVPLNDGTQKLLRGDPNDTRAEHEIEPNRVFTRSIHALLPNVTFQLGDANGAQKEMMKRGYDWMQKPGLFKAVLNATEHHDMLDLGNFEGGSITDEKRMSKINSILMERAQQYYHDAKHKPTSLTIAIVRDQSGHYYMGKHSSDGTINATPSAELEAIGAMTNASSNNRLTDIFIVSLNEKELEELNGARLAKDIAVKMPDGATREIIKKFSPRNDDAKKIKDFFGKCMEPSNGHVHVFLPNNPYWIPPGIEGECPAFDPKKHVISMRVKELLPYAYKDPKGSNESMPARQ
jgi:cytidine deaminase